MGHDEPAASEAHPRWTAFAEALVVEPGLPVVLCKALRSRPASCGLENVGALEVYVKRGSKAPLKGVLGIPVVQSRQDQNLGRGSLPAVVLGTINGC